MRRVITGLSALVLALSLNMGSVYACEGECPHHKEKDHKCDGGCDKAKGKKHECKHKGCSDKNCEHGAKAKGKAAAVAAPDAPVTEEAKPAAH